MACKQCVKYSLFVDFFKWILLVLGGKDHGKMKTWFPDYTETTPGLMSGKRPCTEGGRAGRGSQQSISFCSSSEADDVVEVQTPTLFQLVLHLKGPLTHPLRLSCVKYSLFVDFFKWILSVLRGKNYGKMKTWLPDYTETTPGLQYKDLRVGSGPVVEMRELFCWTF
ncbi:uncharacterized protein LOC100246060 isoform X2 [Vitis vinifera]|uniref:uncharacterized protein LOC100246060 isoform X2 n=1 Tax=Vitis vinifera TaxID=29760 RepID=UPI00053FD3D6|nr:uncharacterized protein LOC100246060 isoform X2 [Vitis vinifera]|eukprot:XP_010662130.1 PREDICTED: uncharacterized protein LOC100246060 isoform X4 [Vitis vinifera]